MSATTKQPSLSLREAQLQTHARSFWTQIETSLRITATALRQTAAPATRVALDAQLAAMRQHAAADRARLCPARGGCASDVAAADVVRELDACTSALIQQVMKLQKTFARATSVGQATEKKKLEVAVRALETKKMALLSTAKLVQAERLRRRSRPQCQVAQPPIEHAGAVATRNNRSNSSTTTASLTSEDSNNDSDQDIETDPIVDERAAARSAHNNGISQADDLPALKAQVMALQQQIETQRATYEARLAEKHAQLRVCQRQADERVAAISAQLETERADFDVKCHNLCAFMTEEDERMDALALHVETLERLAEQDAQEISRLKHQNEAALAEVARLKQEVVVRRGEVIEGTWMVQCMEAKHAAIDARLQVELAQANALMVQREEEVKNMVLKVDVLKEMVEEDAEEICRLRHDNQVGRNEVARLQDEVNARRAQLVDGMWMVQVMESRHAYEVASLEAQVAQTKGFLAQREREWSNLATAMSKQLRDLKAQGNAREAT